MKAYHTIMMRVVLEAKVWQLNEDEIKIRVCCQMPNLVSGRVDDLPKLIETSRHECNE